MKMNVVSEGLLNLTKRFGVESLDVSDKIPDDTGVLRRSVTFSVPEELTLKELNELCKTIAESLKGWFGNTLRIEDRAVSFYAIYDEWVPAPTRFNVCREDPM